MPESMCNCFGRLYIGFPDEDPGAACGAGVGFETNEAESIIGRDELPAYSITISGSEPLLTQSARTVLEVE